MFKIIVGVVGLGLAVGGMLLLANRPTEAVEFSQDVIVIDVRTPQEHATGHLEGSKPLDLSSGELEAALPTLNKDAEYLVYCRSGNRSAQAVRLMLDAGFTNVTDLGSFANAKSKTGIAEVR